MSALGRLIICPDCVRHLTSHAEGKIRFMETDNERGQGLDGFRSGVSGDRRRKFRLEKCVAICRSMINVSRVTPPKDHHQGVNGSVPSADSGNWYISQMETKCTQPIFASPLQKLLRNAFPAIFDFKNSCSFPHGDSSRAAWPGLRPLA